LNTKGKLAPFKVLKNPKYTYCISFCAFHL